MESKREHKPCAEDRRHVRTLAALGLPPQHIASLIRTGISEDTLNDQYSEELIVGQAQSAAKVAAAIHNRAVNHQNIPACALSLRNSAQPAGPQTKPPESSRPTTRQSYDLLPKKEKRWVLIDSGPGEPIV